MDATSLIMGCREGDPLALEEFVRRCQPVIERLAISILEDGTVPSAQDEIQHTVQETMLDILHRMEQLHEENELRIAIYTLGMMQCRKTLRRRRARGVEPRPSPRGNGLPGAVYRLEERLRFPMLLYYSNQLPLAETARVLRISPNTLLSRLYHAREQLRAWQEAG